MNEITLDKQFFTGGHSIFTVDNGKGQHYTFKIKKSRKGPQYFFVSLLTGRDNTSDYTYMGVTNPLNGDLRLTQASRYNDDSTPVKVFRWTMKHVFGDRQLPDGYTLNHCGRCGCCGRLLTVKESILRGIGPECWSKIHGA